MPAEVAEGEGAQEGLADGVREDVGVGVAVQSDLGLERHATQDEGSAAPQGMEVEAEADSGHERTRARARRRSAGVVIFTFSARPGTTRTSWPSRSTSIASSVPVTPSRRALSCALRRRSAWKA